MALARINGPMLQSTLERQGTNLSIVSNVLLSSTPTVIFDVVNNRLGVNTSTPQYTLDVNGNSQLGNIVIYNNTLTSTTGKIALGSIANVTLTGGTPDQIVYTDGAGNLAFGSLALLAGLEGFTANNIIVGTVTQSSDGFGTSALTTGMDVATAIYTLDNILGNISSISGNVITTGNLFLSGVTGYTTANNVLITDGTGNTSFINASNLPAIVSINSNVSATNANLTAANLAISNINSNVSATNANLTAANLAISNINSNVSAINANINAANLAIAAISANVTSLTGNLITLGANTVASLTSNAVTLTQSTKVTDAIAQLNYVLGKLVPPSPPNFPNGSISLTSGTSAGLMCNFTQTDNSGWGNLSVSAGTSVSAVRASTYTAGTVTSVGPGNTGTVTAYLNGVSAGSTTLTGSSNGTYGNLIIASNQDYHNVVSTVTAGFWYSFNASLSGSSVPAGWNRANITDSATGAGTNTITWYYDSSSPGTPTFSNTSIALNSNTVSYSSTVPHFNSSTTFTIKGNVARLSGDTYPTSVSSGSSTMVTGSSATGFQTPTSVTYTSAGVTVPLARNLYVSSGSAYFETTSTIATGFGSTTTGPGLSVNNNYLSGTSGALIVSGTPTILYKTGTSTNIEETSIPVTSVGTGSGNGFRIANPGSTDNPSFTGSESTFNSTTGPFYTYDATNVGSSSGQGVIKFDQTNYSTGYLPIGPNLSSQGANQYFTFKFTRTTVSKFDIVYSGTIAGLWVALPGSTIDTTASPTSGWLNMAVAYAGSGVPGTGTGGNGSAGCSTGGVAVLNSAQSNKSVTSTFGTVQSGSSGSNAGDIYVRIKLTSGQSLTALSIVTATH